MNIRSYVSLISVCVLGALALAGCTAEPPAQTRPAIGGPEGAAAAQPDGGYLIVNSATFAPTAEQSEYPVHTDYSIATANGDTLKHIVNRTGPFGAFPVRVRLSVGDYRVRAQYAGGRFVVVPVVIEADKTTTIDLTGGPLPQGGDATAQPVRLPDGAVVGWLEGSARSNR